ncbi:MAG: hypothetical protein CML19_07325 [Pusillimonas sp.]|nr:hypothetical protein [Pusillimonas sp.]
MFVEGDIHEIIKTLEDDTIDFIYTDPPFGITSAPWDKGLNWSELFPEMWRVLKPDGIICLYASMPFTYELLKYEKPKYHYSWRKNNSTAFMLAKKQPLRNMEEIFIYYKKPGTYNPQMVGEKEYAMDMVGSYGGQNYYGKNHKDRSTMKKEEIYRKDKGHKGRYPTTYREWNIRRDGTGITRTDDQIDYFIKTYTNEGDTILDMTCNTDSVSKRCEILNREYIGVDLNII